jgi:hypothetical protein
MIDLDDRPEKHPGLYVRDTRQDVAIYDPLTGVIAGKLQGTSVQFLIPSFCGGAHLRAAFLIQRVYQWKLDVSDLGVQCPVRTSVSTIRT